MVYGEAGVGKSNLLLQLARNVMAEGKKTAFIDTEGLSADRISQVFGSEDAVRGLLVFQVHSFKEQSDRIDKAVKLAENGMLGLIAVDSMTMYYRLNRDDFEVRNDFTRQTEVLLDTARTYDVPVVVTSQVYTSLATGDVEFLGGHVMHHNAKTILRLDKKGNGTRTAVIMKHRSLPEGRSADYRITEKGIEDV